MKKLLALISLLCLLFIGADPATGTVRLTIVNKADMGIAVKLTSADHECPNSKEIIKGDFYYLTVLAGSRDEPTIKSYNVKENTYLMQLLYLEIYDPVYGFKCNTPAPNAMRAKRDIRLIVLPCDFPIKPKQIGEPSMLKYLPAANTQFGISFQRYWLTRLIY